MTYLKNQRSENEIDSQYYQAKEKLEDAINKCMREYFDQAPVKLTSTKTIQELGNQIEVMHLLGDINIGFSRGFFHALMLTKALPVGF